MTAFEVAYWRERALERRDRAVKRGTPLRTADTRLVKERIAIDAMRVVIEWAGSKSLTVNFSKDCNGKYEPSDREITVSARATPITQLYILLHECGHHLVGNNEKHERFGRGYASLDPNVRKTLRHRLDILNEEFEAWYRGLKLAQRLGIVIDKKSFDRTRDKFLKSYVDWVSRYRKRRKKKLELGVKKQ